MGGQTIPTEVVSAASKRVVMCSIATIRRRHACVCAQPCAKDTLDEKCSQKAVYAARAVVRT